MKTIYISLLLLLFGSLPAWCQQTSPLENEELFSKIFPQKSYLEDLDELAKTLTETHPNPYKFSSKAEFDASLNRLKKSISASTTYAEFIWKCSELVANVNCGHTSLGFFNQESRMLPISLRFPVEARLIEERLYVSDPLVNEDKLQPGAEIFAINGKAIEEIQEEVFSHISSQGKNESFKKELFNGYFTAYIPYALGFPTTYTLLIKGRKEAIVLDKLSEYQYKPRVNPQDECQGNLCLRFLSQGNTALLTIRSFAYYGEKFPIYTDFIDESFREIKEKASQHLILDLRMNDGGPSDAGIYLLQHLVQEPFRYFSNSAFGEKQDLIKPLAAGFSGEVYTLIDGGGVSTAGHVVSLIKELKLASLVGEELGSNHFCTGGQKQFYLSHTQIGYRVGRYNYEAAANSFRLDRGILPDHPLVQSIQDYLEQRDSLLEYAKLLIEND